MLWQKLDYIGSAGNNKTVTAEFVVWQIFAHYIDNFEKLNDPEYSEYYKWQVCHCFRLLMDKALAVGAAYFVDALSDFHRPLMISVENPFICVTV